MFFVSSKDSMSGLSSALSPRKHFVWDTSANGGICSIATSLTIQSGHAHTSFSTIAGSLTPT